MHWLLRSGATAGPLQLSQNRKKETRFSSKSTISQAPPAPHPIPPDPYSTTPRHQPTYLQNPNQHPSVPNQPDPPAEMAANHRPTSRSNYSQPNHQQSLLTPGRPPITPLNQSHPPPYHLLPPKKAQVPHTRTKPIIHHARTPPQAIILPQQPTPPQPPTQGMPTTRRPPPKYNSPHGEYYIGALYSARLGC